MRWLVRLGRRHAPGLLLLLFAVPVVVLIVLDATVAGVGDPLDHWAEDHAVAGDLLWHAGVAAAVAAVAVYWVLGRKRQKALRSYRRSASDEPAAFVEWSRGETPVVRLATCQRIAAAIRRSGNEPTVAVLQGRPGTGRTSCVVGLVSELAKHKMIPIPVLAKRDGSFELQDLAREKFYKHVDRVLSSDRQADEIWHRARSTRDIVILVDGLDDEIIGKLSRDGGKRFRKTIKELRSNEIAVVLATTRELPLGDITPLREDLDLFNRDETTAYVQGKLKDGDDRDAALAALERLDVPIDGFLVAPFYVDLIVRLQKGGISLERLPRQTDRWRAEVLKRYLHGIETGKIDIEGTDAGDLRPRARAAKKAAEQVADTLRIDEADRISVAGWELDVDDLALRDAEDLNLLWSGDESVGFANEDLGAYLVATRRKDPAQLLRDIRLVAESDYPRKRRDRYVRSALIFWHLRHKEARIATFEKFLTQLEKQKWTRPSVIVAAVRIVCACSGLTQFNERVAKAAEACRRSLDTKEKRDEKPWQAYELLGLVRALAAWPRRDAHRLLWSMATKQDLEIEWWAAKALAMSKNHPERTLESEIHEALDAGEAADKDPEGKKREQINRPDDDMGQRIASLAWILPALGSAQQPVEPELTRLRELCLKDWMSPLRGEMQLAQGLKLAILNGRMVSQNVELVRELLIKRKLRFWHARLVLVQALLAHAWDHREDAETVKNELAEVVAREPHRFVEEGINFAHRGLSDLTQASDGLPSTLSKYMYMWSHEREAVRWVELGKDALAQLAADVVLLSNMTYRLREHSVDKANETAARGELPPCIQKSSRRQGIDGDCNGDCKLGLCRAAAEGAVLGTRAQFSASFCRDQARLVGEKGAPSWVERSYNRTQQLKRFWDTQADLVQSKRS